MTGIEALLGVYAAAGLVVGYVTGYAVRGRKARREVRSAGARRAGHAR